MAELKPHPPGTYPVVVVGSGPGGLQTSYLLTRLGIKHAVLSEDDAPGGMFRRFPILQRLISWSKPYAPVDAGARSYPRFDWNSLLVEDAAHRALVSEFMDGSSYFPARSEMEASLAAFAERAGVQVRYGCRWESTRREDEAFVLGTSDGDYRCRVAIFAVGMAEPWKPSVPGLEDVPHYADTRAAREYAGRSVLIIGKRNSGFELADGLLPWARQITLISPRPAKLSVVTRSLVGARARYLQPYEDHVLGGGNVIVDAALQRVERSPDGFRVLAHGTTTQGEMTIDADEVIAATGFRVPLQDLRALGVATFMEDRLPAQSPFWESATAPGIYFAGSVGQGATELNKHGIPSSSAAVHGFRYNAVVLVRHIAEKHLGMRLARPEIESDRLVDVLLEEATEAPELWNQRAYLARGFEVTAGSVTDQGIVPLSHFVDASGPDAVAVTIESDPQGSIYPVLYVRRAGKVDEHPLPPTRTHDYRTSDHRALVGERVKMLLKGA